MMMMIISSTNPVLAVISSFYKEPPVLSCSLGFWLWFHKKKNLNYFTREKYNLQKILYKKPKSFKIL